MAYLIITTAIGQYGFFWKLTLANFVKVNCQLVGISANARKQETILKFMLPNGQRISINILEILIIEKGIHFQISLPNRIPTKLLPFTTFTKRSHPDFIKLGGGVLNEFFIAAQNPGFKIPCIVAFHSKHCSC